MIRVQKSILSCVQLVVMDDERHVASGKVC